MFTSNLLIASSPATFTKPAYQRNTINASSLLNPNIFKTTHIQTSLFIKPTSQFAVLPTKASNFGQIYGYPLGVSSRFTSLIHDSNRAHDFPSGFCSKHISYIAKASVASESEHESTPEGEAAAAAAAAAEVSKPKDKTFQLAIVFGLWYFQNIVFNIYNKKALNVFPFPWFVASFQLFVGSVWMLILWSLKLQPFPKISKPFVFSLLRPALFHTISHISACISLSKVAVSFTHVIKSSEPVFSVVFTSILGDTYPLKIWLSILPIVLGCSLAALTEVSFNFQGLWGALIMNVGISFRNIYSKKGLQRFKEVNGLNMYGCISIISLIYLFPVAVIVEGSQWVQGYQKAIAAVGKPSTFHMWVLVAGIFYHLYNQSSYQALDDISPLTFSVSNAMKSVAVIVSTILVFRNPVTPLNAVGSAIAIFGAFLYSQATSTKANKTEGEKKN